MGSHLTAYMPYLTNWMLAAGSDKISKLVEEKKFLMLKGDSIKFLRFFKSLKR